jgi:hypothetical protein
MESRGHIQPQIQRCISNLAGSDCASMSVATCWPESSIAPSRGVRRRCLIRFGYSEGNACEAELDLTSAPHDPWPECFSLADRPFFVLLLCPSYHGSLATTMPRYPRTCFYMQHGVPQDTRRHCYSGTTADVLHTDAIRHFTRTLASCPRKHRQEYCSHGDLESTDAG